VDAISVLKEDHKLFRRLVREFDATTERAHAPITREPTDWPG
jgi:hypothetical protein